MQYFERAVFEYHPNPPPHNVLLARVGAFRYAEKSSAGWVAPPHPVPPAVVPAPPTYPTPTPQPEAPERTLFREAFGIHSKLDRYQYSLVFRATRNPGPTDAEGLFVRNDGATMKGIFRGVPVDLVVRGNRIHSMEGGVWVERRLGEILAPLGPNYKDSQEQSNLNFLREPAAFELPFRFDPEYPGGPGGPDRESLIKVSDEMMHGVPVAHYRYSGCFGCFAAEPSHFDISAWIDPQTRYIHRYTHAGYRLMEPPANDAQPETDISISRHNDPTVQLPTP